MDLAVQSNAIDAAQKTPPHDSSVEQSLLGALLVNSKSFLELTDILTPASFYIPKHTIIFETMIEIIGKGDAIDAVTVGAHLQAKDDLERIGGNAYLAELIEGAPTTTNIVSYARIIQEKFVRRRLVNAGSAIVDCSYQEDQPIEKVIDASEKKLFDVTHKHVSVGYRSVDEGVGEIVTSIIALAEKGDQKKYRGVPTGFNLLNDALSGFQPSDLVILAARPSMGKTTLALDIARLTGINHQTPIGIFSLEMSEGQLLERMLAAEAQLHAWKLRTGRLRDEGSLSALTEAVDRLSKTSIYIDDHPGATTLHIRSTARRMKREHNIQMIIVDYLQLITAYETRRSDSLVQQVTEISRTLKLIARELQIPVIALSQLSRDIEKRAGRPRLSDLRDSGSIEQDADVVMFLHRKHRANAEEEGDIIRTELIIEKHRNGPTGAVELLFDKKHVTFREEASEQYQEIAEGMPPEEYEV